MTTSLALEFPARALLLDHHELYSVTAHGAPISPGPGWILFWSPLTVPGLTGLMGALALGAVAYLMRRVHRQAAGIFVCLMLLQPLFLSQMANGQDLFVISLALTALILLLNEADGDWQFLLLGLWGGVIATARVPIVAFVCALGLGVWKRSRRDAILFTGIALTAAVLLHGSGWYFAIRDGHIYQPMHVLARAANGGGIPKSVAVGLLLVCFLIVSRTINATAVTWLLSVFGLMCLLFTPEGVGEYLTTRRWDWEGAVYISFPIPLLAAAIATTAAQRRPATTTAT